MARIASTLLIGWLTFVVLSNEPNKVKVNGSFSAIQIEQQDSENDN